MAKLDGVVPRYTRVVLRPGGDRRTPARVGAAIPRLRSTLAAEGLASAWLDPPVGPVDAPFRLIAIGVPAGADERTT